MEPQRRRFWRASSLSRRITAWRLFPFSHLLLLFLALLFLSGGLDAEILLAIMASSAFAYFFAMKNILGKLEGNFFSRLERNLGGLRPPFIDDMVTIESRLDTSKVMVLNLVMNFWRDSFSLCLIPISMSDMHL